jgi:glycosyltransferase involved in cell wall biosynthesis
MSKGWLVNDTLTCIPGTKTLWHDLLEGIEGLEDKTFGHTSFSMLADKIENEAKKNGKPDYIIRNATFFRKLMLGCRTISLLQDVYQGSRRAEQISVCNNSSVVVFNSPFIASKYNKEIVSQKIIIPIGIDFELFKPIPDKENIREELGILKNSVLFVGDSTVTPKGFDLMTDIIRNSSANFCLVMKDDYRISHPRIRVFNKVSHDKLVKIYNSCSMLVCTSRVETLHLAGIEAAACGLPILTTNVGIYFNRIPGKWGMVSNPSRMVGNMHNMLSNLHNYDARAYFLNEGLDKKETIKKWSNLVLG